MEKVMGFEEIIGQDKLIQNLKRAIVNHRIPHAYIFDGPEGIGKELTALTFAKAIDCRMGEGDACDQCPSCIKFQGKNHPDIQVIAPEGSTIKNKQIEDFQQDILIRPYESKKKIYIFRQAHLMTVRAQNRILKTLEEPPEYAVIIFITTNANSMLSTIRSRCQILKFQRVGQQVIEEYMLKKYGLSIEQARIFAAFSDGIVGKAVRLKESETFQSNREETVRILEELLKKDPLKIFSLTEFFEKNKEAIEEILDFILLWFRDLLLLKETGEDRFLINLDQKSILQKYQNEIGYEKISNIIAAIEKTKKDIKANINFQLSIEMLLLKMQEV